MSEVEFRILGPLEVVVGDRRLVLGGHKQRAVLAVLLLHANELVSTDAIIDAVWGEEAPPTAGHAVQVYISQLRKLLQTGEGPQIVREAGGYRLEVQREALDVCRLEDRIAEARQKLSGGDARDARENLERALELWRATPFAEFAYDDFARSEIERLEDLRVTAFEYLADARLALGEHADVVDNLYASIARFPLREKLRGQLMLALYRCGRQADALQVYSETRQVLSEELGIEPNPLMQRLHEQVLQQSPDLDVATSDRSDVETTLQPADAEGAGASLESRAQTVQEMRTVTVLMAGMSISTKGVDAERLDLLHRECFEIMSSIARSAGAVVDPGGGDRFTAVFGFPRLHEDDAERALTTAIKTRDRLRKLTPYFEDRYGFAPAVRIGVATGEIISPIGGEAFPFTGAPFTRAAELLWKAPPGEVVADERLYRSAGQGFTFEGHDVASADRVWRVDMHGVHPAPRTRVGAGIPLVGRVRELEALRAMYESSAEDLPPQTVHILGEAGIGKTRLVEEFLKEVASDAAPPLVLNGRCLSYGEGITYWALREIVWELAGIGMNDPGDGAVQNLRRLVVRHVPNATPEHDRVLNTLAITAGIHIPDAAFHEMSPETVGEEMALGWPSFVTALATEQPVILVLEDLHWAEDALLEMLQHIRLRAVGKVFILATARPGARDTTAAGPMLPGSLQLSLAPLSRHENLTFLARLIPGADHDLRHRLAELAEGNPFFLQELVRRLLDEAAISEAGELLRSGRAAELALPETIRALLAARIDALPALEKRILQEASVVGRVFWASLVQRMQPKAATASLLQSLESRGLIVLKGRSSLSGDREFAFGHGLTRETAYASIPSSRRARAHAVVGAFIEERSADQRAAFVEVIAHHYATAAAVDARLAWADDPEAREEIRSKAVLVLLEAGRLARSRYDIDQSIAFFERAATLAASDEERFAVSEERARSAHAAVRTDLAWTSYVDALAIARSMGDREKELRVTAAAGLLCARYGGAFTSSGWRSELPQMISAGLSDGFRSAPGSLDTAALLVGRAGLAIWGVSDLRPEEALRDIHEAVSIAESVGSPSLLAHALDVLRSLVLMQDGFCRSGELAERMIDVSSKITDPMDSHELLVEATDALCEAGSFTDAETTAARASLAAARLSPHHKLHAASAQVSLLYPQGAMTELLRAAEEAIEIVLDEDGQTCMRGELAIFGSALALYEGGRRSEAEEVLQLVSVALSPPSSAAPFYLRGADMLRTLRGLDRTAEEIESIGYVEGGASEIWFLRAQLPVLALMGDEEGVRKAASRARQLAASACAPALAPIADMTEAMIMAREGSSDSAAAKAEVARSVLSKLGEPYPAARLVADLIPFLAPRDSGRLSRRATASLEGLGANATLAALAP